MAEGTRRPSNFPRWRVAVSRGDKVITTVLVANVKGGSHDAVMATWKELRELGVKRPQDFEYAAERW